MTTLEDAREQLLSQIEMELCRIYHVRSKAPEKLKEFYNMISELPLSNFIFGWYRENAEILLINCNDEECGFIGLVTFPKKWLVLFQQIFFCRKSKIIR